MNFFGGWESEFEGVQFGKKVNLKGNELKEGK